MRQPGCLLLMAGLFLFGCGGKEEQPASNTTNPPAASRNPLTAPVDYLGAVGAAQKSAIKTLDVAQLTRQIQLFYEQEERYPKDLQELVKLHYLNSLPQLPAGMKYRYNPQTGEVKAVRQ